MKWNVFMYAVLAGLLSACGPLENEGAELDAAFQSSPIIQGQECGVDDYPSAVAVLVEATVDMGFWGQQDVKTVVCTGTLIAPDVVLTAAHCVDPEALTGGFGTVKSQSYSVTFEPNLLALAEQKTTVFPADAILADSWVKHEMFALDNFNTEVTGPGNFYDIGLIFLAQPVTHVQPAVLISAAEASQMTVQTSVAIVGWGQQTQTADAFTPPPAGTVGEKICANSTINEIGAHEMQIGTLGSRKCHGDSGGPSYMDVQTNSTIKERVVGITSHAYDETDCAKGGVDTRVDVWLNWIDTQMVSACNSGARSWCEVKGVIPASYYEPDQPNDNPNNTDGTIDTNGPSLKKRGCAQTPGAGMWLLAVGLWFVRRR